MGSMSWPVPNRLDSHTQSHEPFRARQELLAAEALERAVRRREQLAAQASSSNPPAERIRIWEQAHQVRLPHSPTHAVLQVVAQATGLTLEEVQAEQRARRASQPDKSRS